MAGAHAGARWIYNHAGCWTRRTSRRTTGGRGYIADLLNENTREAAAANSSKREQVQTCLDSGAPAGHQPSSASKPACFARFRQRLRRRPLPEIIKVPRALQITFAGPAFAH